MKPTVPEVIPLVEAVYARSADNSGCCLHVMVDDKNCGQDTADYCLKYAKQQGHEECIAAAEAMAQMSNTQRRKVAASHRGYAAQRRRWEPAESKG